MSQRPPQIAFDTIAVYLAGTREVNGVYSATSRLSAGFPMFRKRGTNVGVLKFDDGKVYISDCGEEFTPAGVDHLDFYLSESKLDKDLNSLKLSVAEDGLSPAPRIRVVNDESLKTLASALQAQAYRHMKNEQRESAVLHLESVVQLAPDIDDFISLTRLYLATGETSHAYRTLVCLSKETPILFNEEGPLYTPTQRVTVCQLLSECVKPAAPLQEVVPVLLCKSLYPFFEFIIPLCDNIRNRMELRDFNPHAYDDGAVERLLSVAEARKEFQLAGGLEVAISFREFYRNIERYTFDQRDCAINRMKIFSCTDSFRQSASDGKLDIRGRDGTFKNFWEVGLQKDVPEPVDPREEEARIKDLDPAKEMKCSVIKGINEQNESSIEKFLQRREELQAKAPKTWFSLSDIQKCDCNNSELKMISIHGIVFDVTHNLEKYAPDGEYFFFPGHDITYPLAVSSLSGDHVDELYKLENPEHLKRVYGWMEYFVNKYEILGRMKEYENEAKWEKPPQGEEEPEMQCAIM